MEPSALLGKGREIVMTYGLNLVFAILIFIIGKIISRFISNMIGKIMKKKSVDATLVSFVTSIIYTVLVTLVIITALGRLGVQTTSFVAILGAAGLAIGLSLQGLLANFASGFLIMIFKPFKAGDFIEGGGVMGVVEALHIFTTTLKTPDNKIIIVPNSKLSGDNLTNYSAEKTRRVDFTFGVGYEDDLKKVRTVLTDIIANEAKALKDPAPFIGVSELADSSVNFAVRVWAKTEDYWDVFFNLNEAVKLRFDQENISIPYPQRDVHNFEMQKKAE